MLVVDASFAIEASLTADGLDRLRGRNAIAPPLMWSEGVSVLHEMQWRRVISAELAEAARIRLQRAAIRVRRPARLLQRAWEIAGNLGWAKTYDAEYLALADLYRCPILTVDGKMARVAAEEIDVLSPADL
jgi:predicted nucleic acid-binding protein